VRPKDRIFSRSSVTAPLPEEEDAPFVTPLANLDNLVTMINAQFEGKPVIPLPSPSEEKSPVVAVPKRKRGSAEGMISPPPTAEASVTNEAVNSGPARRTSKRRR
jgi:hypothetical protein